MIYYRITLFENKSDGFGDNSRLTGGVKGVNWLKYDGDDNGMPLNTEIEDESLAMKILLQNLQLVQAKLVAANYPTQLIGKSKELVRNQADLEEIIQGQYEKVIVEKYQSDLVR